MSLFHVLIGWLILTAIYLLWNKFREDRADGKSFWDFGDFNFLVRSIVVMLAVWGGFTLLSPELHFKSDKEQIAFGEKTRQPWLVTDALWKTIEKDPGNLDANYQLLHAYLQQDDDTPPPDILRYNHEGIRIFNHYTALTEKTDDPYLNDVGQLFLAQWYIERPGHDVENAMFCLRQIRDPHLKYANYFMGRALLYSGAGFSAEASFVSEIQLNGFKKGAWEELAWIYDATGDKTALKNLVYDPESRESVPESLRYKTYFLSGDIGAFYLLKFRSMFGTLPIWGILGDLIILFTWLFFLRRLSFLSPMKWKNLFLAVLIGSVIAMLSWLLYEFYHHVLHFNTNGNIGNDFLYCFLGIGVIEELVKLVPFLLILRFTNIIKKPVDYLLIASASGLGFAFFENLLYISHYGLEVIHARALTASVSHMACSAIVAYGFILAKFRYPGKWWIVPLFFLAAALAHGFYDFWLLNEKVRSWSLSILTFFFYLSEVLVYVSFLNNALNQSVSPEQTPKDLSFNTQRLAASIAGALLLVFTIEYAGACLVYGTHVGNETLNSSFLSGGYLIFFLSVRLSNIDIVPGEWAPIEFFAGILPSDLGRSRKRNLNALVGTRITLKHAREAGTLYYTLPISGNIERRLTIAGDNAWFELRPDVALQLNGRAYEIVYFRTKDPEEMIGRGEPVRVGIFVREPELLNPEKSKLVFLDWANAV